MRTLIKSAHSPEDVRPAPAAGVDAGKDREDTSIESGDEIVAVIKAAIAAYKKSNS
ncbi:MAG: hypothetical protein HZB29_13855 [Nitrospinae bacterium]|nr:hypothetical protein [Nitrospinota bacterium]